MGPSPWVKGTVSDNQNVLVKGHPDTSPMLSVESCGSLDTQEKPGFVTAQQGGDLPGTASVVLMVPQPRSVRDSPTVLT